MRPFERQSGGETGHVLFGYSDIQELRRKAPGEIVEHAEAEVGREQHYLRAFGGDAS